MSLIPYLRDFERPWSLEREFLRPDDFFDASPFQQLMPRDFFAPQFSKPRNSAFRSWDNCFKPFEELTDVMNRLAFNELGPMIKADDDEEKFQVNVDVQHFSPEEVKVKVINGYVVVEGKHEEKKDQHGFVSREFVRRYKLPEGCLPDTVESKLSSDGVLTVTAPKVLALPSIGERIVPVTHTGPVSKQRGSPDHGIADMEGSK